MTCDPILTTTRSDEADSNAPATGGGWTFTPAYRLIMVAAVFLTVAAVAVVAVLAFRHETNNRLADRHAAATAAAREWVKLLVATTDGNFLAQSRELEHRAADPLKAQFAQRMGLFFEIFGQHDAETPLKISSAAIEAKTGDKTNRPPSVPGAVTVLLTTTLRHPRPGGGYSLWLEVVERNGREEVADLGIAGSL